MVIADIMRDMRWVVKSAAIDKQAALQIFNGEWHRIIGALEEGDDRGFLKQLKRSMAVFRKNIQLNRPMDQLKYIGILGEIYVRHDLFALQGILDRLAEHGFTAKTAPIHEWILYMDYCIKKGYQDPDYTLAGRLEAYFAHLWQRIREQAIKKICSTSGLYHEGPIDIDYYIRHSTHLVPAHLKGEPGLSSGHALALLIDKYCGIVNIGPFGCMNSRLLQAVLAPEMTLAGKKLAHRNAGERYKWDNQFTEVTGLPLFTVETDGNPFPQIVEAQFENFCIQAGRLHDKMMSVFAERG
jgi:predicted nucleotide-binding protein (sugar kinase/HSP70/actin superfamily)